MNTDNIKRSDRRDSSDEKEQLKDIRNILNEISENENVKLDLEHFTKVSRGSDSIFIGADGEYHKKNRRKSNPLNGDSKTIDAKARIINTNGDNLDLLFFCKRTEEAGGSQDYIMYEIYAFINAIKARNSKMLSSNKEIFIIYLEGGYWTKRQNLIENIENLPKNIIFSKKENLKETIENLL